MYCQAGSDRAQQGGLLKQCLACWNQGQSSSEAGLQETAVQDTVEMLVSFVEQSQGPSAADIVDIAQVRCCSPSQLQECRLVLRNRSRGGILSPTSSGQKDMYLFWSAMINSLQTREQVNRVLSRMPLAICALSQFFSA